MRPGPPLWSFGAPTATIRSFHNMCRHRGNKLVWNDYPQRETSGTCRQFTCKYHGWRYSVEGELTFVQQESEFFNLDKEDYGLAAIAVETWEGFIFVNLDPDNTTSLQEYLGDLGAGMVGLSVRQDDPGLQVPGRCGGELEIVHRRLRRVLPRPDSPREAGDRRGVPQALRLRIRGVGLRARRAPRHGVVLGRDVATEGSRHGQADRAGLAQRTLRSVEPPRYRRPGPPASGDQPGPPPGLGRRLVRLLSQFHGARLADRVVPHVSLLAHVVQHTHLRGHAVLRPPKNARERLQPRARRGHVQGVRAPGRQHAGGDPDHARVEGRLRSSPSTTRRSCSGNCTRRPATTSRTIRRASPTPVRISAAS